MAPTSSSSRRSPGFDLRPLPGGLYSFHLWGPLPHAWASHLSLGLAAAGIGIVRGQARRRDGRWEGELHLRPTPGGPAPVSLDYARLLSRRGPAPTPASVELIDYRVLPLLGTLALEVTGRDGLGFLGSLLGHLACLSLFPEELRIETHDDRAVDHFRLKAHGSRAPTLETARALDRMLRELAPLSPVD